MFHFKMILITTTWNSFSMLMDMTMLVCLDLVDYICHTLLLLQSKYGLANANRYTDMRCKHVRSAAARIKTQKAYSRSRQVELGMWRVSAGLEAVEADQLVPCSKLCD